MAKRRRTGKRSVARGVFAVLWIGLAGLSGLYLFTLFTDPSAVGGQIAEASQDSNAVASTEPGFSEPEPTAPAPVTPAPVIAAAPEVGKAEVDALKGTLDGLAQQLAALDERLKPIERFVGPVAALPPSTSVSTSPPAPQAPAPRQPPVAAPAPEPVPPPAPTAPEPAAETAVETPPPSPPTAPAAAPAQPPAQAPQAQQPQAEEPQAQEPQTEAPRAQQPQAQQPQAQEPRAQAPRAQAPQAQEPSTQQPPDQQTPRAAAQEEVQISAFDPVALPPAANDGSTRYGIEIGVVAKRDELRPLWREYLTKHAALVAGLQPRRVLAPDNKWRLIAGPFSNAQDAEGACSLFKKAERPCSATVYAGDAL